MLKLFHIRRPDYPDFDEYSDAVVCAESAEDAATIHPDNCSDVVTEDPGGTWIKLSDVIVDEIGIAADRVKRGVIVSSFRAG